MRKLGTHLQKAATATGMGILDIARRDDGILGERGLGGG